ncbi:hypothetical protein [Cohnella hongkongensis]|uniref:Uncharacterized protein n=1 Tax=Cohnella hongkongensis TaxID=178337 RepID=A0ABV9FDE0_9BACL
MLTQPVSRSLTGVRRERDEAGVQPHAKNIGVRYGRAANNTVSGMEPLWQYWEQPDRNESEME